MEALEVSVEVGLPWRQQHRLNAALFQDIAEAEKGVGSLFA